MPIYRLPNELLADLILITMILLIITLHFKVRVAPVSFVSFSMTLLWVGGVRLFIIPTLLRMLDCQRITHHIFLKLLNVILLDIMYYLLKKKPKYFIFKFFNFFIQSSVVKRGKINRALKWLENCFSNRNGPSDFQFWIYWELRSMRPPLCNHQTLTILIQSF